MRFGINNFCLECYKYKKDEPEAFYSGGKNQLYCKKCLSERRKRKRLEKKKKEREDKLESSLVRLKEIQKEIGDLIESLEKN